MVYIEKQFVPLDNEENQIINMLVVFGMSLLGIGLKMNSFE